MAVRLNTAARNAAVDAITALVNGGYIRIYTGAQPATPATAPTGTLLAELPLSNPAFAGAVNGTAALDVTPIPTDAGIADGTAGWARFLTSAEQAGSGLGVIDGNVTATGGGGQVTLATTSVVTGVAVNVTSGSCTMPAS